MLQANTYIEKLESHFHPRFIGMKDNQEQKRWHTISYVRMLEEMCKDRGIEIEREPFPVTNNLIYIKDQHGNEHHWRIYDETDRGMYKIRYYDMVTDIYINKVYKDLDGRLCYSEQIYIPEDVNRFSLSFVWEYFIDGIEDI